MAVFIVCFLLYVIKQVHASEVSLLAQNNTLTQNVRSLESTNGTMMRDLTESRDRHYMQVDITDTQAQQIVALTNDNNMLTAIVRSHEDSIEHLQDLSMNLTSELEELTDASDILIRTNDDQEATIAMLWRRVNILTNQVNA